MTLDIRHPKLNNLENQLGNALGVALAVIRDPALLDNRTMADLEKPFKKWCDKTYVELTGEAGDYQTTLHTWEQIND